MAWREHVQIVPSAKRAPMKNSWRLASIALAAAVTANVGTSGRLDAAVVAPHATHVTVVFMENRNYGLVVGNPRAPYFNNRLIPSGRLLENSHAIGHPSEPNYLELFSGSNQGVTNDSCPHT